MIARSWIDESGMDRTADAIEPVWLQWTDVGDANLDRLAWLARVDASALAAIVPTGGLTQPVTRLPYCYICL